MIRTSINGEGGRLGGVIDAVARGLGAMLQNARDRRDYGRMLRLPDHLLDDIGVDRQELGRRMPRSAWSFPRRPDRASGDRSR